MSFPGAQADALRFGVTTLFDMYSLSDQPTIERWRKQRAFNGEVGEADTYTAAIGATPPGGHPTELMKDLPSDVPAPPTLSCVREWRAARTTSRWFKMMGPAPGNVQAYLRSHPLASLR